MPAFYCHICKRSFQSQTPRCPACQQDFVQEVPEGVAANLDIPSDTDAADADAAAEEQEEEERRFQQHLTAVQAHLDAHREAIMRQTVAQEQIINGRRVRIAPPTQMAQLLEGHFGALREQLRGTLTRQGAFVNPFPAGQPAVRSITTPDGPSPQHRTFVINLGNGSEVTVGFNIGGGMSPEEATQMETAVESVVRSLAEQQQQQQQGGFQIHVLHQSILTPFMAMFGMVGDPRDYVNDPARFNDLLDRMFHSQSATAVPMPAEGIAKLPREPCAKVTGFCPVCLSTINAEEEGEAGGSTTSTKMAITLPACGHAFHEQCLVPWLERCATCPVCRGKPEC